MAEETDFKDGWEKGRAIGFDEGVLAAQEYYATVAEDEVHHCGDGDGEIWIVRRIVDLIRANRPLKADGKD